MGVSETRSRKVGQNTSISDISDLPKFSLQKSALNKSANQFVKKFSYFSLSVSSLLAQMGKS